MFSRKSQTTQSASSATASSTAAKEGGKGRPTPTRKEAEAARKARLKPARTRKEQAAAAREQRARAQQAMKTGDERYLPPRDRGPVRRFVRDWVDVRFTVAEIILPLLVVAMVLGYVGSTRLALVSQGVILVMLVVVIVNLIVLRFGLRRQLRRRFPDQSYKGTTYYMVMRAVQLRVLRMPKPQLKIGGQLPETYH
ncbi:MAG: DUF3043 domain-containing protein [Nocardioides sp.]